MSDKKRFIYVPKERKSVLLRVSSILFCMGVLLMWLTADKFGFERGDLLIMSGIALLLITLSIQGKRAERRAAEDSRIIERIREETGKSDYNSDIFYN